MGWQGTASGPWKNEKLNDKFVELFNFGISFAQIAARLNNEFGASISRNACIGRAHRLNVPRRVKFIGPPMPRAPRKRKPYQRKTIAKPVNHELFRCDPVELSAVNENALHCSLDQLMHGQCRYPFGDGPFTFCGQQALSDRTYCKLHFAATHVPFRGYSQRVSRSRYGIVAGGMVAA